MLILINFLLFILYFFFIISDREKERVFICLVLSVSAITGLIGAIKENLVMVLILALTFNFSFIVDITSGNYLPAIYHFVIFTFF
jgi:LytS/YehU family sensor histidine kinase